MSDDVIKIRGTTGAYKANRGGQVEIPYPVKGIVKDNIDSARTGRIRVYIEAFSGLDPNNSKGWVTVNYLPPYFGVTPGAIDKETTSYGTYKENPHSYGFWAQPPDLESEVICIFLNGKKDFGYYIGCIPSPGLHHMVPAIGSTNYILGETGPGAHAYGGASVLPTVEKQPKNRALANSLNPYATVKPIHKRVATQLFEQGLIKDKVRGTISSSSMRESPSRVFGISTPGRPLYKGGLDGTDEQIAAKIPGSKDEDLKIVGRRGGHSIVMDDGDFKGKNNLMRFRTAAGHQITMSDDGQTIFIIHSNGQSYIEMGKEGTVDIFTSNSMNVRTQGDLNFHADRKINFHAKKEFNVFAEKIKIESEKETIVRVGTEYKQHTVGDHTLKVDKKMSFDSAGDASMASAGTAFVNGAKVNLNTGSTSLKPAEVKATCPTCYPEVMFDKTKGWTPCPGKLKSITTRCPTHTPWPDHNKGVCCAGGCNASGKQCQSCGGNVSSCNGTCGKSCNNPVEEDVIKTAPANQGIKKSPAIIDPVTTSALTAQSATNAAFDELIKKAINGISVDSKGKRLAILGKFGHSPTQLESAGYLKPGSGALAEKLVANGASISSAMPSKLFTGKDNITSIEEFLKDSTVQANTEIALMTKGIYELRRQGIISGQESPDQLGGLALASAKFGADKTIDFVNTPSKQNPSNPIFNTYAAGNYAANLADKSLTASGKMLDSLEIKKPVTASNRGSAFDVFESIKESMPPLEPGPQNLKVTNPETETTIGGVNVGATAFVDSENSMSNETDFADKTPALPTPNELLEIKRNKKVSLKEAVYLNADRKKQSRLNSLIGSLNAGNYNSERLPVSATNTFDRTEINEQVKILLGPGVPASSSSLVGTTEVSNTQIQLRYDQLYKELETLESQKTSSYENYVDSKKKFGPNSQEAKQAELSYKSLVQKIAAATEELQKLTPKL